MTDYEEEVARGAAWLDANAPPDKPWYEVIDLDVLEMDDCSRCVLGQTFAHHADLKSSLPFGYDYAIRNLDAPVYGTGFSVLWGSAREYDILCDAWVALIKERRVGAAIRERAFGALGPEGVA